MRLRIVAVDDLPFGTPGASLNGPEGSSVRLQVVSPGQPPREIVEAFGPEAAAVWAEEEIVIVTHAALGKIEKHVLPFFERFTPASRRRGPATRPRPRS